MKDKEETRGIIIIKCEDLEDKNSEETKNAVKKLKELSKPESNTKE